MEALPGVESAALARVPVLSGGGRISRRWSSRPHRSPTCRSPSTRAASFSRCGAGDPARLAPAVRGALEALEPNLPLPEVRPLRDAIGRSLYPARMGPVVLGRFGIPSLALAFTA